MKPELTKLRYEMQKENIDYFLIPSGDDHNSEYVNAHFKCREYISGFTGSAGTLLAAADAAWLWTDGRYFLQAEDQLADSGIQLMKIGEPGVPTILEHLTALAKGAAYTLGFDGSVLPLSSGEVYEENLTPLGITLRWDLDLPGRVWEERPPLIASDLWSLPREVTGISAEEKIRQIRNRMDQENVDHLLLSDLTEIAWTLNLRANDIANTPVFYAYLLITDSSCELFLYNTEQFQREFAAEFPFLQANDYDKIGSRLSSLPSGCRISVDPQSVNYRLIQMLPPGTDILESSSPVQMMKAVKNPQEIRSTKSAHLRDGAAVTRFIYWLKQEITHSPLTEMSASDHLDLERLNQDSCFDLSFPTISGYAKNGAVIHYTATAGTDSPLKPEGFLLVDSGGQYLDGTTDITRTISLGPLTKKMKEYYTLVLKSHIALASARFSPGTTGFELDNIARKPLQEHGLDFNHGTGHGIGHILSVHEGPNTISKRGASCPILPGMITSNEPGIYIEGEFGIRLENEILCVNNGSSLAFEPLTLCPFDRDAILPERLSALEKHWINEYHERVLELLQPLLDPETQKWLEHETLPIL